jgi:elongation factor Ts
MAFTAKDVQALRQATGAGMMDAKKALEANDGDMEAAKQWLREKGLAASAKRDDRENTQGVVALVIDGNVGAIVKLKSETDFVASSDLFKAEAADARRARRRQGQAAVAERNTILEDLKITLKEKIELGEVVRIEAAPGNVIDSYLHIQGGRGVNGVLVEMAGATPGARPRRGRAHRLRPSEVPQQVPTCRPTCSRRSEQTLETISRNEGKPEAALPKIIEGRMQRLLQGRRTARPALCEGRQAVGQAVHRLGDHRRLRPGRDRLQRRTPLPPHMKGPAMTSPRWKRIVFKPSGEAIGRPLGSGLDGDDPRPHRSRDHRRAGDGRRRGPSSSAAATSGVAARAP